MRYCVQKLLVCDHSCTDARMRGQLYGVFIACNAIALDGKAVFVVMYCQTAEWEDVSRCLRCGHNCWTGYSWWFSWYLAVVDPWFNQCHTARQWCFTLDNFNNKLSYHAETALQSGSVLARERVVSLCAQNLRLRGSPPPHQQQKSFCCDRCDVNLCAPLQGTPLKIRKEFFTSSHLWFGIRIPITRVDERCTCSGGPRD